MISRPRPTKKHQPTNEISEPMENASITSLFMDLVRRSGV